MAWTEQQVDRTIGVLLRTGVILAAGVVSLAAIWYHAQIALSLQNYQVFHSEPAELTSPRAVVYGALQGNAEAWIQFGLLLLIATPVARVAYSAVAFALQRDWTYVGVTLIVLGVLLYGSW
jgi:uncharacterized membrane protein